jgi:cell division protein FtsB
VTYRDLEPVSKQLTIVVGLTVVGFMAFGLALSYYRNVLFEVTLENIRMENDKLRSRNSLSQSDVDYYRSAQYKDKYAKENLGKVNAGEKLLILNEKVTAPALDDEGQLTATERQEIEFEELLRQMPVLEHWKLYLFHPERIEELKRAM